MHGFRGIRISACLSLAFAFGAVAPALAHAHLTSEVPAANAVMRVAPQQLRLRFSEALEARFSSVTLTGPGQSIVSTGRAALDAKDDAVLIVPLPAALPAGRYIVDWRAVSTDTHRTQGSYSFTIEP